MLNLSRGTALFSLTLYCILFLAAPCQAQENPIVVINEIAWMGTKNSYNDEWIELFNNTSEEINLSGWQIIAKDGAPAITLSGKIPARGFYLLERTNDDTLPEILADQIYSGAMGNNGENFTLYDATKNIIDSIDCGNDWFMGDNASKQTMERKNPLALGNDSANWQTSQNLGGTPKNKNSTPLSKNIAKKEAEQTSTNQIIAETKEAIPENNQKNISKEQTASIASHLPANHNQILTLGAALVFALISGGSILIIRRKTDCGLE